jgi:hypothetical protein
MLLISVLEIQFYTKLLFKQPIEMLIKKSKKKKKSILSNFVLFVGYTKLLVGVGFLNSKVEIVDLASSTTTCRALPNFPTEIWNSVGGLGFGDQPLICGGFNGQYNNGCFTLEGNKWISSTPLSSTRINAVASLCPYQINSHMILVTGGFNKVW